MIWAKLIMFMWLGFPSLGLFVIPGDIYTQGFIFYLVYSFGNYWIHRLKHSNRFLWHYFHRLHHSPTNMGSQVAFFRHPSEVMINSLYLLLLVKLLFSVPLEVVALALVIEGCLESFHHANIYWPRRLYFVGYIIQTPPMHLVHHERGLHRYNYSPFFWDTFFGTVRIPLRWNKCFNTIFPCDQ